MHEIGVSVIWLSFQVTIVAVASALLYLAVRRRGPLLRSLVISSSMLVVLLLAALAFSPWPRWGGEVTQQSNSPEIQVPSDGKKTSLISDIPAPDREAIKLESVWSAAWGGFVDGLKRPQPVADQDEALTWPALIGILFLVGATFGLMRLCIGYLLLRREIQHSDSLDRTSARELLDGLLLERNKRSSVRLLETKRLATAAIIGWWRPVILLPHTWKTWSSGQLRAVLTHELAHIEQRDYLSNISAEICRSIHFYHPLMHWLVSRLRLEQELAADAAAAQSAGGAEPYLVILAEMAMEQSNRSVLSPARAFLPTQSTFLRRIDMLKDKTPFRATVSRTARAIAVTSVLLAGMLAVGIRGESVSIAQNSPFGFGNSGETKKGEQKFRIDFVPNNALAVFAIRPADILAKNSMKPIRKLIEREDYKHELFIFLGLKPAEIEILTAVMFPSGPSSVAFVIQLKQPIDRNQFLKNMPGSNPVEIQYLGKNYSKLGNDCLMFLSDTTLIFTEQEQSMQEILKTLQLGGTTRWAKQWQAVENDSVAALVDIQVARAIVGDKQAQVAAANAPILGLISPIWENTDVASLGLSFNKNFSLNSTLYQEKNGGGVKDTLDALLILAKNMLGQMKRGVKSDNVEERLALMSLINVAENVLKLTEVTRKGENVRLTTAMPEDSIVPMVSMLVPAIMESRERARRMQSMNNLKKIMLALHNYYDIHKHFPPAVVLGPDGKTPHSWRVAILPYLDQQALYNEYHMDEPWDSEHNMKIAKTMVPVFHNPNDDGAVTNASYFVLVGDGTAFGNKAGLEFQKVTDGTSNTIAVVEAKRNIPWTKPEDIPYDGKKIPKLGGFQQGGFNVGLCDGSVRFISDNLDPKMLRNLLIINDGNVVNWDW
ncbi:DUF1559 domain-containing protein [uncultured Gimesia sp.]|uniref:DUF1559 family PulG-like putative transporter n=1 Tax=uncultured Gimesia sp. TaxID=1678688 RepID=UPI00262CBD0A|nr:DUF1559 domain-containing protein [uncultured Gimesia sp.]